VGATGGRWRAAGTALSRRKSGTTEPPDGVSALRVTILARRAIARISLVEGTPLTRRRKHKASPRGIPTHPHAF
jgi:hypothetical protein